VVVLGLLVAPSNAAAQGTTSEFQSWAATFLGKNVGDSDFTLWFDGHARRGGDNTVAIIRPALGYRLTSDLTVHLGYAWVPTFNDGAPNRHEHRVWQQLLWVPKPVEGLVLNVRPRFEQRLVQGESGLGLRARLFLRANYRFGDSPFLIAVWDEVFLPVNDAAWGQAAGFDQNRIFVGPGIVGYPGMRVEVGYLNVVLNRATDAINHVLALNLFLQL
jgi:hypothetical protein